MYVDRPRIQAPQPAATGSATAKRCAEALQVASELRSLPASYSPYVRSHERHELDAMLFMVFIFEPAWPDNCNVSADRRGDCVCIPWLYSLTQGFRIIKSVFGPSEVALSADY